MKDVELQTFPEVRSLAGRRFEPWWLLKLFSLNQMPAAHPCAHCSWGGKQWPPQMAVSLWAGVPRERSPHPELRPHLCRASDPAMGVWALQEGWQGQQSVRRALLTRGEPEAPLASSERSEKQGPASAGTEMPTTEAILLGPPALTEKRLALSPSLSRHL